MSANVTNAEPSMTRTFLALAPPHWVARGLSYAIIAVVLITAIASVEL